MAEDQPAEAPVVKPGLSQAEKREALVLMPLGQRDPLLIDDYDTLPHLKCVSLFCLWKGRESLKRNDYSRPRSITPFGGPLKSVHMTSYSDIFDSLEGTGNGRRSECRPLLCM